MDFTKIKLLVIDVDGTLTDAGIYYDDHGNELKKFCTRDAAGFFAAKACGIQTMILTGRECPATTRRMKEMKVDHLYQNIKDKKTFLTDFMKENQLSRQEVGYVGDDLNDLPGMSLCGFVGCPADACEEIKAVANYISPILAGHGAFRDVVCYLLKERGEWERAVSDVYGAGI